ncbi:Nuclease precursor [Polystyrenella longa]|uniref:Nuclease n=1 Tax=Polystyrenella longa TaxID=2528007 RepID=A0A518CJ83_9PLAN|nr:DNA/RNA non-specific endonuclease [Polystyrenella longa]QDU79291.1 Nuclease precursor [Polystyrenella longa]
MWFRFLIVLAVGQMVPFALAAEKPIVLDPSYRHDILVTQPQETMRHFRAYTVSFDSDDDDGGDGDADLKAIPEWVAYEMRRHTGPIPKNNRPEWFTDSDLFTRGEAARTDSYHFSQIFRASHSDSMQLGYDRGHFCMKHHAARLGAAADWNTHTTLNCFPQRNTLNQGAWLDLENKCAEWADHYGRVWIITGPIIYGKEPRNWLGEQGEVPVAIPDAVFKIIYKPSTNKSVDVMAFIYPQETPRLTGGYDHRPYLTSIRTIEHFTGLQFFTRLTPKHQEYLKIRTATELWPISSELAGNEAVRRN